MPKRSQNPSGTSPPWQQLSISPDALQDLKTQSYILHLLHHRSANQHRRSAWYRHFSLFRKQVRCALEELDPEVREDALPSRRFKVFAEARRKLEMRLQWWADVMVERWWTAFGSVVGDKQFAVLGVTLVAVLGRVVVVLGLLERIEAEGGGHGMVQQLKSAAEHAERKDGVGCGEGVVEHDLGVAVERPHDVDEGIEDIGVVVGREVDTEMADHSITENKMTTTAAASTAPPKAKSTKKKRKGGDEIDDLFSGLF